MLYTEKITLHPQSVNTTLDSTVYFPCEAFTDEINFKVNDKSAANRNIVNRGFIEQPQYTLSDGRKRRVLSVKALINNNNTNIVCRAIQTQILYSNIAVLRIQGELIIKYVCNNLNMLEFMLPTKQLLYRNALLHV